LKQQEAEVSVRGVCSQGLSIACSTPEAIKWDKEFEGAHEISGRAMKAVHLAGHEFSFDADRHSGGGGGAAPAAAFAEARNGPARAENSVAAEPLAKGSGVGAQRPQTAPLPAMKTSSCSRLDVPKGVVQAAKANGIHVAAS
jgi:asparagine synthase (glutamine-hydrolysing)